MTERRTDQPIPPLPEAHSPRELDDKILAHARANAPRASRGPLFGWGGGLATAAVLVLAVYLVKLEDASRTASAPPVADTAEQAASETAARESKAKAGIQVQADSAAPEKLSERQAIVAGSAEELAAISAAPPRAAQRLDADLEALRTMVKAGQIEQARAAYADLLERCKDCNLPARLEDALRDRPD